MVGVWSAYSSQYLYVVAIGILAAFGLPMLIAPITFARILRGGLASVVAVFGFKAAGVPALLPFYYQMTIAAFCILTLVHIYGAIRKIQPITETLEIAFWFGLIVVTLCFYPG